ncbi:lipase regulator 1 [Zalerion maritima]|uniref:Lipase regulator 1 n=1 Tax=Zalerion maritima TaxID=339359 RepID=A0AAD5WNA6_9PEZI|nr:lipase regulator 1 [Zalerion maritima]
MSNDPGMRRPLLLPQTSGQVNNFAFAPPVYQQPRETQKNYVFVDEHNRHKRLKVMRACEGCRRRKIKCDAATTNTWPCGACIRLKLHCVRPNGHYDGTSSADTTPTSYEPARPQYDTLQLHDSFRQQVPMPHPDYLSAPKSAPPTMYAAPNYPQNPAVYQQVPYADTTPTQPNMHYTTIPPQGAVPDQPYAQANVFPTPPLQQQSRPDSPPESYNTEPYNPGDLADLLGSLKVNEAGTAPYLNRKTLARPSNEEEPAVEDVDEMRNLPPITGGPGMKIRIPPELMPDDETIQHYFDLFFNHVHPYVPVLNKTQFLQQWHSNRESVSPLIIEAIFAIGGRLADEPAQGQQWLALASKHADSFMDVPRLSTLQAMLIGLKAREAAPKKGYYYRSWMAIVQCVQMAKDLGLDEHLSDHQAGQPCGSSPEECMLKTRIWQTIFICEVMIGSPQGRTDLSVNADSVDSSIPRPVLGDESEYNLSRNFTYFVRIVQNVSRANAIYAKIKKKKEWGIDPEFVRLNPSFNTWLTELPNDLSVDFPPDGSPVWVASSFIGNVHSYYYLSLILLHRPQLTFLNPNGGDRQWKSQMMICYNSAKLLCRLQEGILQTYGLVGLQSMQRGVNFTIYCVLSCIVLHLVAITSPDPDFNSDAREYFTRHMRILERCMSAWPMPDMQRQIDSIREAFSADTTKLFVLKPSFPYGSPHSSHHSTPRAPGPNSGGQMPGRPSQQHIDTSGAQQVSYAGHPISPPISAGPVDTKGDSSIIMMPGSQGSQAPAMPQAVPLADAPTWNPNRIFDQWNTTFGTPSVSKTNHPSSPPVPTTMSSHHHNILTTTTPVNSSLSIVSPSAGAQEVPSLHGTISPVAPTSAASQLPPQQYSAAPIQSFVTPAMWQESVASVYEGGLKRRWDGH